MLFMFAESQAHMLQKVLMHFWLNQKLNTGFLFDIFQARPFEHCKIITSEANFDDLDLDLRVFDKVFFFYKVCM